MVLLPGILVVSVIVCAVTVATLYTIRASNIAAQKRAGTAALLLVMASLENDLADEQTGILGYVSSHQERFINHYNTARIRFEETLAAGRLTLGIDAQGLKTLDRIREFNLQWETGFGEPLIKGEGDKDPKKLQSILQEGARTMIVTRRELNEFLATENERLANANREDARLQLADHVITFTGGFLALSVCLLLLLLTRRIESSARRLAAEVTERTRIADQLENALVEAEQATQSAVETREELADYSHKLEAQVAARTAELTQSNANLTRINADLKHETAEKDLALKRLKDAQSFLLQSEKMASLGQLAAGVAHEINNPIGFINSNLATVSEYWKGVEALLRFYGDLERACDGTNAEAARIKRQLQETKKSADLDFILKDTPVLLSDSLEGTARVVAIVQNLKEFSHVDSAQRQMADVNVGIESTLKLIWNELKYKVRVEKDLGPLQQIECYPQQLNQVFVNLFVNAAQAIEKEGTLRITTRMQGERVALTVSDTGCGIQPEHVSHIFEPFFTTKPVGKGTGLGLSVVYSIVKHHGGSIDVQSEVGKGTTFHLLLPVRMPESAAAQELS
ncbi:MAG TPA: ATP-binding protein [bacterium]|nr:ATP-binding protein [bacterium]